MHKKFLPLIPLLVFTCLPVNNVFADPIGCYATGSSGEWSLDCGISNDKIHNFNALKLNGNCGSPVMMAAAGAIDFANFESLTPGRRYNFKLNVYGLGLLEVFYNGQQVAEARLAGLMFCNLWGEGQFS